MDVVEIDLKRLLHRMQGLLANNAHGSISEEEAQKRWTYVEHAQKLLQQLSEAFHDKEEDKKRLANYESKLNFISQLM